MKARYSEHIIEIVRLMLKFDEAERPSFTELSKLVLTSTENSIESPKGADKQKKPTKVASTGKLEGASARVNKAFSVKELRKTDESAQGATNPIA